MSSFTPTAPGNDIQKQQQIHTSAVLRKNTLQKNNTCAENVHIFFRVFGPREHCINWDDLRHEHQETRVATESSASIIIS